MALLSIRGFDTPSLPAQGEQRLRLIFNIQRGNASCGSTKLSKLGEDVTVSIGVQSGPQIGVQKGPFEPDWSGADVSRGDVSLFGDEAFLHPG
jgi:hypothetical protein